MTPIRVQKQQATSGEACGDRNDAPADPCAIRLGPCPDVLATSLDGETVILNTRTGKYYALDSVGERMWALLLEHGRTGPVLEALLDEYEVTEEHLQQDLSAFIHELKRHGLLQTLPV